MGRAGPEPRREVGGEVGVAVLGGPEDAVAEVYGPELGHVVDDDEVGVEVDDAADGGGEQVGEVHPGVVEGLVQGAADGVGDLAPDEVGVEVVEAEREVGEGGGDGAAEVGAAAGGGDEVEDDVLGAGGVLEDGEDAGDGSPEVGGVEGHRDVDGVVGVGVGVVWARRPRGLGALSAVPERGGFSELREIGGDGGGGSGGDEEEREEGMEVMVRWRRHGGGRNRGWRVLMEVVDWCLMR